METVRREYETGKKAGIGMKLVQLKAKEKICRGCGRIIKPPAKVWKVSRAKHGKTYYYHKECGDRIQQ